MDSVMKFIGCCDTQANMSAEINITRWSAAYLKGVLTLSLETRFWTNCTQVKKGDRLYLHPGKTPPFKELTISQLEPSRVALIHCQNEQSLTGAKNFKLPVSDGEFTLLYLRPINIYSSQNERLKIMGHSESIVVDVPVPACPLKESVMEQSFSLLDSEYHHHVHLDQHKYLERLNQFNQLQNSQRLPGRPTIQSSRIIQIPDDHDSTMPLGQSQISVSSMARPVFAPQAKYQPPPTQSNIYQSIVGNLQNAHTPVRTVPSIRTTTPIRSVPSQQVPQVRHL